MIGAEQLGIVRRLEGQSLARFSKQRFDFSKPRAGPCGQHQLGGFVVDHAIEAGEIEAIIGQDRPAERPLGAGADDVQRTAIGAGLFHRRLHVFFIMGPKDGHRTSRTPGRPAVLSGHPPPSKSSGDRGHGIKGTSGFYPYF